MKIPLRYLVNNSMVLIDLADLMHMLKTDLLNENSTEEQKKYINNLIISLSVFYTQIKEEFSS